MTLVTVLPHKKKKSDDNQRDMSDLESGPQESANRPNSGNHEENGNLFSYF